MAISIELEKTSRRCHFSYLKYKKRDKNTEKDEWLNKTNGIIDKISLVFRGRGFSFPIFLRTPHLFNPSSGGPTIKLASTREGTLFFGEALWKNSDLMCPLLSCDSFVVNNRDVRSTWPRPLTALVQYFSGQTDARPDACGSFVRMEDDNSAMAKVCKKWGGTKSLDQFTNIWSLDDQNYEKRLYDHVVLVWYKQHWLLSPESKRFECDDFNGNVSTGDFWKIYVRWGLHRENYYFCRTYKNSNLHKILFF